MRKLQKLIDIFWLPSLFVGLGFLASAISYFQGYQQSLNHPNLFGLVLLAICFLSSHSGFDRKIRLFFILSGLTLALFRLWWFFTYDTTSVVLAQWYANFWSMDFVVLPLNYLLGILAFLIFQIIEEVYDFHRKPRIWTGIVSILMFSYVSIGTLRFFFEPHEGFTLYSLGRIAPLDAICIQIFSAYYIFRSWVTYFRRWNLFRTSLAIGVSGGVLLALVVTGIERQIYNVIQNQMERKLIDIQQVFRKNVDERLSIISIFGDFLNNVPNPTETQIYAMMNKLTNSGVEAPAVYFYNQNFSLKWVYRNNQFSWGETAQSQIHDRQDLMTAYLRQLGIGRRYLAQKTAGGLSISYASPLYKNRTLAGYLVFEDQVQPQIQFFFSRNDFGPYKIHVQASDGSHILNTPSPLGTRVFAKTTLDFLDEPLTLYLSPSRQLTVNSVFIPQISFLAVGLLIICVLSYTVYVNRKRVMDVEKEVQDRIQELKVLKEEADQAKSIAEHASYSKSQFLANMSHEIRTPLNVLLGASELLSETQLNVDQKKYVEMFQTSGKHLLGLLNDIIDLSRIESGLLETEKISFDLLKTLEFVRNLFSLKAQEQGLQFIVDTQNIRNPLRIGDPLRIRQILVNLIGNSFKFTNSGTIKLQVSELSEEFIQFIVEDTGSGIPDEKQNEIFETFQQGDASFSRKHGGAGLGLAISKNLCEIMGGSIELQSRIGIGSKFIVKIPISITTEAPARTESAEPTLISKTAEVPGLDEIQKQVLLVDDSDDNRFLVKLFLENSPYQITEAKNGEEAVDFVKKQDFDIILMDMQMPVMDGYEAVKIIREFEDIQGEINKVPILALTAHGTTVEKNRCLEIGCTDYLSKPVSKNTLLNRMSDLTTPQTSL